MIVYKTFPLGGRCPSAHTGADEGYIPKVYNFIGFTPHQSKIKDFCQLPPRGKLYAKQSFIFLTSKKLPLLRQLFLFTQFLPIR